MDLHFFPINLFDIIELEKEKVNVIKRTLTIRKAKLWLSKEKASWFKLVTYEQSIEKKGKSHVIWSIIH